MSTAEGRRRTVTPSRTVAGLAIAIAALVLAESAGATAGLVTTRSPYSVTETMDRLERAVRDRDLIVVAPVDHAAAAQKPDPDARPGPPAGLTLRPTQLLIFGNPKAGTPLMQSAQSIGIDLPLKVLVWEDGQGQVWLGYNDPAWLAAGVATVGRPGELGLRIRG
jgi:uncharacterized protein (DUF302 family)